MDLIRARGHYENFPVASILLPRRMRRHVAAVYAFARTADDFADEGSWAPADRHRLLDGWHDRLHHAARSAVADRPPEPGEPADTVGMFLALGVTMREKAIPVTLFEDLLSAFRQDVGVSRYDTWPDLLDYCRRSANPVGRIVLRIAGYRDARLDRLSDAICTALQLTNFWQDFGVDFRRGRVYVPAEDIRAHGAREEDLAHGITDDWRRVLEGAVARTRTLFDEGRPLCGLVTGRLRYELRATWLGGVRILDRVERARYDVIRRRPVLRAADTPWLVYHLLAWSAAAPGSSPSDLV